MRIHELIEAAQAAPDNSLSMWDFIQHYGIEDAKDEFHDALLPWINTNSPHCIDRGIRRADYRLLSKLVFWKEVMIRENNWSKGFGTIADFEAALPTPVTIWRGGPGTYDPDKLDRKWVSFTANRDRTKTFTHYTGTYASRLPFLNQRSGSYWVVELTLPLDSILLYLYQGFDHEVIVSRKDAQRAIVVEKGIAANK